MKIPFLPKRKKTETPSPKRQKARALSGYEASKQRQDKYLERLKKA